jgi:hypothetical protein
MHDLPELPFNQKHVGLMIHSANKELFCFYLEQATDPSLESEDWALNLEICDMINESSSDANSKDAMKAIRKRLTQYIGKNYTVIL